MTANYDNYTTTNNQISRLDPRHWQELQASAIAQDVAEAAFRSISGSEAAEIILNSREIPRTNTGSVANYLKHRYACLEDGGWLAENIDVFTGEIDAWGSFKPDSPYFDEKRGKIVKYEHPYKQPTKIIFLPVPPRVWEMVARRYEKDLPEGYETAPPGAFWAWVREVKEFEKPIPIIITEGAKKAAALLSMGFVAVAVPGVFNAYRQRKDIDGQKIGQPSLIPELAAFAEGGRELYICYDKDSRHNSIKNVNFATRKLAELLIKRGCGVKIMDWSPALGKGIDDVAASAEFGAVDKLYREALSRQEWEVKQLRLLTYQADIEINERYLPEIDIPRLAQLVCLKSPKGTGKTEFFKRITDPIIRTGTRRVLAITHRVQLGGQLASRLGLPYVTEVSQSEEGSAFGMVLCVDSLHFDGQAKFNPDDWKGCWLILDEISQLIWHLISSSTCEKNRVKIIKNFKQLLLNIIHHGGKIFIADADLNDIAIDFIKGLIGEDIEPFIINNTFTFNKPWLVNVVKGKNAAELVKILENKLQNSEKCFVCLSSQKPKSRYGSYNLAKYFKKKLPELKILVVDSSTIADPSHPAFGCIPHINEVIKNYDLVIATPTIETGVSIDEKHFDNVFGIFQGIQATDSVRQHLSRIRDTIPRYIWINKIGINRQGCGDISVAGLLSGEHKKNKAHLKKLSEMGFTENLEGNFENIVLQTWAKLGAIINYGMSNYNAQIIEDLREEGHTIWNYGISIESEIIAPADVEITKREIDENKTIEYAAFNEAKAAKESITDEQFEKLDKQIAKNFDEQLTYGKAILERKYLIPTTSEICERDDNKWHPKIQLHFYMSAGREFLPDRDKAAMESQLKYGEGDFFIVDSNKKALSNKVATLDFLNIPSLVELEEISNKTPDAIEFFAKIKKHSYDLKIILGIDFRKSKTPIEAYSRVLDLIGYKLPCLRKEGAKKQQFRVYGKPAYDFKKGDDKKPIIEDGKAVPIDDQRFEIFEKWHQRDLERREKAALEAAKAIIQIAPQTTATDEPQAEPMSYAEAFAELIRESLYDDDAWDKISSLGASLTDSQKKEVWGFLTDSERSLVSQIKNQALMPAPAPAPAPAPVPTPAPVPATEISFSVGQRVRLIIDGLLAQKGTIAEIVGIFGRHLKLNAKGFKSEFMLWVLPEHVAAMGGI